MITIGVSSCFLYPDPNRPYFAPKTLCYLENDMAKYLARKDAMPILVPDLDKDELFPFLDTLDGFVFQGGSDVSPSSYNEDFLDKEKWPGDPTRDQYELKMLDYAFQRSKPVLGICRGFQVVNTYFNGTLYQDIQTQVKDALKHRDADLYDRLSHEIQFVPGKTLDKIYSQEKKRLVNTVHHQGIKELGNDLVVEAISPKDKLIEAFSYKDLDDKFILGVQWHPEFFHTIEDKLIPADPLYDFFLERIRAAKSITPP